MKVMYYILFDNHEQALKLRRALKSADLPTTISPTPREASLCCGVSLMLEETMLGAVQTYLSKHPEAVYKSIERVEQDFNPKRDHYL